MSRLGSWIQLVSRQVLPCLAAPQTSASFSNFTLLLLFIQIWVFIISSAVKVGGFHLTAAVLLLNPVWSVLGHLPACRNLLTHLPSTLLLYVLLHAWFPMPVYQDVTQSPSILPGMSYHLLHIVMYKLHRQQPIQRGFTCATGVLFFSLRE